MSELITMLFPSDKVRVIHNWVPAHARYYRFLGIAIRVTSDGVLTGVYGTMASDVGIGVVAVRKC